MKSSIRLVVLKPDFASKFAKMAAKLKGRNENGGTILFKSGKMKKETATFPFLST